MNWRGLALASLVAGAALSGWALLSQRGRDTAGAPVAKRPDYVLHEFQVTVLNAQGSESFTLHAPRLARDPDVQTLEIATPTFEIPPRPGSSASPWTVQSRTAWVSAKGDELRLMGAVQARSSNAGGQPIRMETEQLNVFPDAKRAVSKVPVAVTEPGLILTGQGLEADLASQKLSLTHAKARYERSAR